MPPNKSNHKAILKRLIAETSSAHIQSQAKADLNVLSTSTHFPNSLLAALAAKSVPAYVLESIKDGILSTQIGEDQYQFIAEHMARDWQKNNITAIQIINYVVGKVKIADALRLLDCVVKMEKRIAIFGVERIVKMLIERSEGLELALQICGENEEWVSIFVDVFLKKSRSSLEWKYDVTSFVDGISVVDNMNIKDGKSVVNIRNVKDVVDNISVTSVADNKNVKDVVDSISVDDDINNNNVKDDINNKIDIDDKKDINNKTAKNNINTISNQITNTNEINNKSTNEITNTTNQINNTISNQITNTNEITNTTNQINNTIEFKGNGVKTNIYLNKNKGIEKEEIQNNINYNNPLILQILSLIETRSFFGVVFLFLESNLFKREVNSFLSRHIDIYAEKLVNYLDYYSDYDVLGTEILRSDKNLERLCKIYNLMSSIARDEIGMVYLSKCVYSCLLEKIVDFSVESDNRMLFEGCLVKLVQQEEELEVCNKCMELKEEKNRMKETPEKEGLDTSGGKLNQNGQFEKQEKTEKEGLDTSDRKLNQNGQFEKSNQNKAKDNTRPPNSLLVLVIDRHKEYISTSWSIPLHTAGLPIIFQILSLSYSSSILFSILSTLAASREEDSPRWALLLYQNNTTAFWAQPSLSKLLFECVKNNNECLKNLVVEYFRNAESLCKDEEELISYLRKGMCDVLLEVLRCYEFSYAWDSIFYILCRECDIDLERAKNENIIDLERFKNESIVDEERFKNESIINDGRVKNESIIDDGNLKNESRKEISLIGEPFNIKVDNMLSIYSPNKDALPSNITPNYTLSQTNLNYSVIDCLEFIVYEGCILNDDQLSKAIKLLSLNRCLKALNILSDLNAFSRKNEFFGELLFYLDTEFRKGAVEVIFNVLKKFGNSNKMDDLNETINQSQTTKHSSIFTKQLTTHTIFNSLNNTDSLFTPKAESLFTHNTDTSVITSKTDPSVTIPRTDSLVVTPKAESLFTIQKFDASIQSISHNVTDSPLSFPRKDSSVQHVNTITSFTIQIILILQKKCGHSEAFLRRVVDFLFVEYVPTYLDLVCDVLLNDKNDELNKECVEGIRRIILLEGDYRKKEIFISILQSKNITPSFSLLFPLFFLTRFSHDQSTCYIKALTVFLVRFPNPLLFSFFFNFLNSHYEFVIHSFIILKNKESVLNYFKIEKSSLSLYRGVVQFLNLDEVCKISRGIKEFEFGLIFVEKFYGNEDCNVDEFVGVLEEWKSKVRVDCFENNIINGFNNTCICNQSSSIDSNNGVTNSPFFCDQASKNRNSNNVVTNSSKDIDDLITDISSPKDTPKTFNLKSRYTSNPNCIYKDKILDSNGEFFINNTKLVVEDLKKQNKVLNVLINGYIFIASSKSKLINYEILFKIKSILSVLILRDFLKKDLKNYLKTVRKGMDRREKIENLLKLVTKYKCREVVLFCKKEILECLVCGDWKVVVEVKKCLELVLLC